MTRKKKKRRVRVTRISEKHHFVSDEDRFRLVSRVTSWIGIAMLLSALVLSYALPTWNRVLGAHGNVALRIAGIALIIVSIMFARLGK